MSVTKLAEHETRQLLQAPYFIGKVQAGFPSPADDYMDGKLDLNEYLIQHPAATFYCRTTGESMQGVGIFDGDLLIVDRACKPVQGDVVLANLNGELTCKVLDIHNHQLRSANRQFTPIPIREGSDFEVEGVVISSIRFHRVRAG